MAVTIIEKQRKRTDNCDRRKNMQILETKEVKKYYPTPSGIVRALDGVSLSVKEGTFGAIVGSSGSGKPRCFICWAVWTSRQMVRCGCGEQH